MQVWATVVHGSAGLHDVTAAGGVTVVVPPDFVDTSIAWPMPALMEPPVAAETRSLQYAPARHAEIGLDVPAAAAPPVWSQRPKKRSQAECAAEGLEWPCHDVGSTIVANNGGYYYADMNDG